MIYPYLWLFFAYAFGGWIAETIACAMRRRTFVNSGLLTGPLCSRYGFFALIITVFGRDLRHSVFFLFIGAAVVGGFLEWASGLLLERLSHKKFWEYSAPKHHLDGHASLRSALFAGVAGILMLRLLNPLLLSFFHLIPLIVWKVLLWIFTALWLLDAVSSCYVISGLRRHLAEADLVRERIAARTSRFSAWLIRRTVRRLRHTYPKLKEETAPAVKGKTFAAGLCFEKLFWLFIIGAFLGDVTETIYCRVVAGYWMSRSSVVWGPFSLVWGFALVLATLLLYNYRNRSDGFIFIFSTVAGGVYEYLCSVFTELVFGRVFWDYSYLPFNLGGRINLLYCFFWGIAAVIWLKKVYPFISGLLEKMPLRLGRVLTVILFVFMVANIAVSALAMDRSSKRAEGIPASGPVSAWLDKNYSDDVMRRIYPNAMVRRTNVPS